MNKGGGGRGAITLNVFMLIPHCLVSGRDPNDIFSVGGGEGNVCI